MIATRLYVTAPPPISGTAACHTREKSSVRDGSARYRFAIEKDAYD